MTANFESPSTDRLQAVLRPTNSTTMSLRFISAVLLALALFLSPVARMSGSGIAMAAEAPVSEATADGHCSGSADHSGDKKSGVNISCASACAAVHAMLPAVAGQVEVRRERESEMTRTSLAGIFTEFETPPPRA